MDKGLKKIIILPKGKATKPLRRRDFLYVKEYKKNNDIKVREQ